MAKVHVAIDTKQKGFEEIILRHALNGPEGRVFVHLHPRWARLIELMEEAQFGSVEFDLRDSLPENVKITRRIKLD